MVTYWIMLLMIYYKNSSVLKVLTADFESNSDIPMLCCFKATCVDWPMFGSYSVTVLYTY